MKRLIIFDLDGTLLDSIADLANSTNYALRKNGFPVHELPAYNFFVGNGIDKLFERALPEGEKTPGNIGKIRKDFLAHYEIHKADYTAPYPGIPELLGELARRGIKLAVASNKYQEATRNLIARYFPEICFSAVFGQREQIPVKPDPTIVSDILSATDTTTADTLYVGDSGVDMQTASNAGVTGVGVTWGFRPRSELEKYHPGHLVDRPEQILELL